MAYEYLLGARSLQIPDPLEREAKRMSLARWNEDILADRARRQQAQRAMADADAFRAELASADLESDEGQARLLRSAMGRGPQYVEAAAKIIGEVRRRRQERGLEDELNRRLNGGRGAPAPRDVTTPSPVFSRPQMPAAVDPASVEAGARADTSPVPPPVAFDTGAPPRGPIPFEPTGEPRSRAWTEPVPTTPVEQWPYGARGSPAVGVDPSASAGSPALAGGAVGAPQGPSLPPPAQLAQMSPAERYLALRRAHAQQRADSLRRQGKHAEALKVLDDADGPITMRNNEAAYVEGVGWFRPDAAPAAPDEFTRRATDAGVQPGSPEYQQLARRRLDEMVRGQRATDSEFFQALKAAGIVEGSPEWQSMSRQRAQRLMRAPGGGSGGGEATIPGSFTAVGVTPDGKQVVFNSKTARNYIVGPGGPVPYDGAFTPKAAHERDVADVGKLRQNVAMGDRLMAIVAGNPDAFSTYMGAVSHLPSFAATRMPGVTPEIIAVRTEVLRDAAMTISDLYGAALSMGEQYRANTFIPAPDDPPDVVIEKLKAAVNWARSKIEGYSQGAQDAAGVRRPGAPAAPAAPAGRPPLESFRR